MIRKIILLLVAAIGIYFALAQQPATRAPGAPNEVETSVGFGRADDRKAVQGSGVVVRLLADDNDGSRHQRFVLRLASGQTLLIAHNIDLAPRVPTLAVGDRIDFSGEYLWSEKGGTLHWTHHDPAGRRQGGWLRRSDRTFQ